MKKMRFPLALFLLCLLFVLPGLTQGQEAFNQNAFSRAFIRVFANRGVRDSLEGPVVNKKTTGRIPFPGGESMAGYDSYEVMYYCKDSSECRRLFRFIQETISRVASASRCQAFFVPSSPDYIPFYIADSAGLTYDFNLLKMSEPDLIRKSWWVLLSFSRQPDYVYFTRGGTGKPDPALASLIREVNGNDTTLSRLKGSGRKMKELTRYTSKKTIPGFTARIEEQTDTLQDDNITIRNELILKADFTGTDQDFGKRIDQMIEQIRASLPADYCYKIEQDEQRTYFWPLPWSKTEDDAGIVLQYFRVNDVKPAKFSMELVLSREKVRMLEEEEEEEE